MWNWSEYKCRNKIEISRFISLHNTVFVKEIIVDFGRFLKKTNVQGLCLAFTHMYVIQSDLKLCLFRSICCILLWISLVFTLADRGGSGRAPVPRFGGSSVQFRSSTINFGPYISNFSSKKSILTSLGITLVYRVESNTDKVKWTEKVDFVRLKQIHPILNTSDISLQKIHFIYKNSCKMFLVPPPTKSWIH